MNRNMSWVCEWCGSENSDSAVRDRVRCTRCMFVTSVGVVTNSVQMSDVPVGSAVWFANDVWVVNDNDTMTRSDGSVVVPMVEVRVVR